MNTKHLAGLMLVLVSSFGCAERQADVEADAASLQVVCMVLPARGYWEDGSTRTIRDEWDSAGAVCMCMTEQERVEQVYHDELNDLAYEECQRIEHLYWDFDWTECESSYESGAWLDFVHVANGEYEWSNRRGLQCDGELSGDCSVRREDESAVPLLLVIALVAWRRRSRDS